MNSPATKIGKKVPVNIMVAAAIGGAFCVFCDYFFKYDDSLINSMMQTLNQRLSIADAIALLILAILLPLLSIGLCYIFEPQRKLNAFYLGASILTFVFNFISVTENDPLKTVPNSAKISIKIEPATIKIDNIKVIVTDSSGRVVGESKFPTNHVNIFLDNGGYLVTLEIPGYKIEKKKIVVIDDQAQDLVFSPQKTWVPLRIQNLYSGPSKIK